MTAALLNSWVNRHMERNLASIHWTKAYLEARQEGREVRLLRPVYER